MNRPSCEATAVVRSRDLKHNYFSMTFGPYSRAKDCAPGQFIHLQLPSSEIYFRRPMSVASVDPDKGEIEIIFKVFGRGTRILSQFQKGSKIDILGPLGRPFAKPRKADRVIMIGGGVGFPPLLFLATQLVAAGFDPRRVEFFYGGRESGEIVERSRIRKLGVNFHPVTDDGSFGAKGLVTEVVDRWLDGCEDHKCRIYSCGPEAMLKAANELGLRRHIPGELSLEAPMPCGIGICLGCVVPLTAGGYTRVCCDGPVFEIGEVEL